MKVLNLFHLAEAPCILFLSNIFCVTPYIRTYDNENGKKAQKVNENIHLA